MRGHGVEHLGAHARVDAFRALLDQAQPEMDVAEQTPFLGLRERRRAPQLARPPDVVQQRGREQQVSPQPLVELDDLAADRGDADRVLEEPARVAVVVGRGGQLAEPRPELSVPERVRHEVAKAGVRDLAREELQEPVELVGIAAHRRDEHRRICVGIGLERANLELQAVAEALDPSEHAHRVALAEPRVEEVDVVPDASLDAAAPVDELEREVGGARPRPQPALARDRVGSLHDPILGELGDGGHELSLGRCYARAMADVRPFAAVRYGPAARGPLDRLVAPPYDVIDDAGRRELLARSPHNAVRLTLPESEQEAARTWSAWLGDRVLERDSEPAFWALQQDYRGPDGVARIRTGLVAALRVEPYERGVVLPHERTHRGPKEGRLRLLRAVRAQLEPIFLLHEGPRPFDVPDRPPELELEGARLWRLATEGLAEAFRDAQLLIADGHHRYETALSFHDEDGSGASAWMLVVLVSTEDPGLTIFPTHRVFDSEPLLSPNGSGGDPAAALADLGAVEAERAAVVQVTAGGAAVVRGEAGELDVQLVDRLGHEGIGYTPDWEEAVRRVREGEAGVAYLLRPTRIEDVWAAARRGEVMPPKTTYFFPKLVTGLLFLEL
jgi:uncharacterized protein (DUF1015 family)